MCTVTSNFFNFFELFPLRQLSRQFRRPLAGKATGKVGEGEKFLSPPVAKENPDEIPEIGIIFFRGGPGRLKVDLKIHVYSKFREESNGAIFRPSREALTIIGKSLSGDLL